MLITPSVGLALRHRSFHLDPDDVQSGLLGVRMGGERTGVGSTTGYITEGDTALLPAVAMGAQPHRKVP